PHPEGLLRIMTHRGVPPGETIMVGDSVTDILAGQGAGAATCAVTYGYGGEEFPGLSPDFTIDRFPELFGRILPFR
ncbi:MAG TPA: phosphoglycolate phosphatase, partial [Deltaproteobacteria bacterium]|nr:phosphoglycolate phosphatase [Deltaproteobacteria bacterium]